MAEPEPELQTDPGDLKTGTWTLDPGYYSHIIPAAAAVGLI